MSKCVKRRFGRTEIQMPVLTCGGMRLQESWAGGQWDTLEGNVTPECQANMEASIRASLACGINHFETARGYGCSELQYGIALKKLMDEGLMKRPPPPPAAHKPPPPPHPPTPR
jgi:predicted aldo/keto reductase-like oxidoreductase